MIIIQYLKQQNDFVFVILRSCLIGVYDKYAWIHRYMMASIQKNIEVFKTPDTTILIVHNNLILWLTIRIAVNTVI